MSKEEQIALELARITGVTTNSGSFGVIENYKYFLKELQEMNQNQDPNEENWEMKYNMLETILLKMRDLLEQDNNNFVMKDDILNIIGGILC